MENQGSPFGCPFIMLRASFGAHMTQKTVSTGQPLETRLEELPPVRKLGTAPRLKSLLSSVWQARHPSFALQQLLGKCSLPSGFKSSGLPSSQHQAGRCCLGRVSPHFPPVLALLQSKLGNLSPHQTQLHTQDNFPLQLPN